MVDTLLLDSNGVLVVPLLTDDLSAQVAPGATGRFLASAKRNAGACQVLDGVRITSVPNAATVQNARTSYPALAEYMRTLGTVTDPVNSPTVVINEVVAENATGYLDPDEPGEYPDWIELFNPTYSPLQLGGMYLTDDQNDLTKFRIPDGISIAPQGYVVFIADNEPEQGPLHTNFSLSSAGEFVGLYAANERGLRTLDGIEYGPLLPDEAYGRYPTGAGLWQLLESTTPGAANLSFRIAQRVFMPLIGRGSNCQ